MSKIILYIATSEDGFIADKNGGVDWLPHPKDDHDLMDNMIQRTYLRNQS